MTANAAKPDELALKGAAVEEWIDVHFFRPLGIRIARKLQPTRVTADQVTMWALWLGVLSAHLLFYDNLWLNGLAMVVMIVADVLDSVDGQLARLRGTSSRSGRILDGYADNVRWIAVYVHVGLRLALHDWGWIAVGLAALAGFAHSTHSAVVDFVHGAYLEIVCKKGPVDLPEALEAAETPPGWWWRNATKIYFGFVRRQARLFPRTVALLRRWRSVPPPDEPTERYAELQRPVLGACPWIGQNAHIALLGVAVMVRQPALFFGVTAVMMTVVALVLAAVTERHAGTVGAES